ncbi:MAG TPA: insulinase family protein [Oscillatoriales cyanobacterium M59_W2019_021]|nr:MAG: insulinase family protein [Cyanobacteria bacterium J055]HIK31810.1 insulinase family protein [Oscillatoriales cyanobacterium M4454_W2019_049]HIK52850.1 insulinase family protein [Oscillatoriales cyanobacterium M59_W2019_021]
MSFLPEWLHCLRVRFASVAKFPIPVPHRGWRCLMAAMLAIWVTTIGITPVWAQPQPLQSYLDRAMAQVTEFTLDNGLKFIVLERHKAPVVSFITYADVGGVNEPVGQTGVAHYLEHLAFKGTQRIGTTNYDAEKPLLEKLDQLFDRIQKARAKGEEDKISALQAEFDTVQAEADAYVLQNQFGQIVEQSGGVGLNANTSADATRYFYSFPANKLELWMSLESERFLEPVFREFFKEKQVILEERRLRTENSPIGKMLEVFLASAFEVHPYKNPVIGYTEDLRNLTRQNVEDFFRTYYVPNNLTIAVVGDVNSDEVRRLAQIYFGRFPKGAEPPAVAEVEPPQTEPREVTVRFPSEPWYLEGYHVPAFDSPDRPIYETIASILSDGRTARLYQSLVEQQQIALTAQGFVGFPGDKYPNLMLFYALTAPGRTIEEVATSLHAEIEKLTTQPVTANELERVKKNALSGLLRSLDSNSGMASLLVEYQVKTGDWRNLFTQLEAIERITPQDVLRVARETFTPQNRTIGRLLPLEGAPEN